MVTIKYTTTTALLLSPQLLPMLLLTTSTAINRQTHFIVWPLFHDHLGDPVPYLLKRPIPWCLLL